MVTSLNLLPSNAVSGIEKRKKLPCSTKSGEQGEVCRHVCVRAYVHDDSHVVFSWKFLRGQSRVSICVVVIEKSIPPNSAFQVSFTTRFPADTVGCLCNNVGLQFVLLEKIH
jgi:hypothetical protein